MRGGRFTIGGRKRATIHLAWPALWFRIPGRGGKGILRDRPSLRVNDDGVVSIADTCRAGGGTTVLLPRSLS